MNKIIDMECIQDIKQFKKGKVYKSEICRHGLLVLDEKANWELCSPRNFIKLEVEAEAKESNKVKNEEANKRYGLWGDFETIDLIKQTLTKEEYIGALKFNILKYKLRDKGCDEEDRIKAQDYQRELNELLK